MDELKRQLGLFEVFSLAAGAMISSGLFVLPAIAFSMSGPAVVIAYAIAAVLILPSALSKAELATAMPRAGGTYFFVERSLGPVLGLFTGFANWFSLALKSAFAVVGMAALLETLFLGTTDSVWMKAIAVACTAVFAAVNMVGAKHAGRLQGVLVVLLLAILGLFVARGLPEVAASSFDGMLDRGWRQILATAGVVFISYGGLTKVASVAEEVERPGRNIALGMLLAWLVVSVIYVVAVIVVVGVTPAAGLRESLAPLALAASSFLPRIGYPVLALAAFAAFVTTANGGILAASRSPMSMSRDGFLPGSLARIGKRTGTPHVSIIVTSGFMVASILILDLETLVKTASTMMIILFILDNISVIVMREARIQSYRPSFRAPLYPYLQIASTITYVVLLVDMGLVPLAITGGFVVVSAAWFLLYSARRVSREYALLYVVERITDRQLRTATLENELRDILLERDEVVEDRFDALVRTCTVLDIDEPTDHEALFRRAASDLAERVNEAPDLLLKKLLARETDTGTVVQPGLAIPHVVVDGENVFEIVLVRSRTGVCFPHTDVPVRAAFVLAGSQDQRNFHLRALMAVAQIAREKDFERRWLEARDSESIRNLILLSSRRRGGGEVPIP